MRSILAVVLVALAASAGAQTTTTTTLVPCNPALTPDLESRTAPGGVCPAQGCVKSAKYLQCRPDQTQKATNTFVDTYGAYLHLSNTFTGANTFNAGLTATSIKLTTGAGTAGRCWVSSDTLGNGSWQACGAGGGGGGGAQTNQANTWTAAQTFSGAPGVVANTIRLTTGAGTIGRCWMSNDTAGNGSWQVCSGAQVGTANTWTALQTFSSAISATTARFTTGAGTTGHCWVSSDTLGNGQWAACPAGGSGGWTETTSQVTAVKDISILAPLEPKDIRVERSDWPYGDFYMTDTVIEGNGLQRIPRTTNVSIGQYFVPSPRTARSYKVVSAGFTAVKQPPGFPIARYNEQRLSLNSRVMKTWQGGHAGEPWYFEVTGVTSGTCASDCSNAGASCSAHATCTSCSTSGSFGCGCTTGATWPVSGCWTGTTNLCSFTDGNCTYTASLLASMPNVTDGTAVFAYANWDAAGFAPSYKIGKGARSDDPQAYFQSGDNEAPQIRVQRGYDYDLPNTDTTKGLEWAFAASAYPFNDSSIVPNVMVQASGTNHPFGIRNQAWANCSGDCTQDSLGGPPQRAPGLALAAGGTLTVGAQRCFAVAWINRITAGKTPVGQQACITPTSGNQKIVVTPRLMAGGFNAFPYGDPVAGVYVNQGNRWELVSQVNSFSSDTVTISSDAQLGEGPLSNELNTGGDPLFDVYGRPPIVATWAAATAVQVYDTFFIPTSIWSTTPPNNFVYRVTAAGCDASCKNCTAVGRLAAGTTGGAEPTWRTDASLFCGNEAAGSKVQYQRHAPYGVRVAIPYQPLVDGDDTSEIGIYRLSSAGEDYLFRTYRGRPQYVCNTEAKPTCDVTKRGMLWYTCSGGGTADVVEYCQKDSGGSYAWTQPISTVTVQDEGTPLTQRTTVNFTGAGVTCSDVAGPKTECNIPGGGASGYQTIQEEGVSQTQRNTLNFIGDGITCTDATTKTQCTLAQHLLLAGRSGGQIVNGGTNSGDDLTLTSTANATKGDIFVTDRMSSTESRPGSTAYLWNPTKTWNTSNSFDIFHSDGQITLTSGQQQIFRTIGDNTDFFIFATPGVGVSGILGYENVGTITGKTNGITMQGYAFAQNEEGIVADAGAGTTVTMFAAEAFKDYSGLIATTGTLNVPVWTGLFVIGSMSATASSTSHVDSRRGFWMRDPGISGAGTSSINFNVGADLYPMTTATINESLRSSGSQTMRHLGSVRLGGIAGSGTISCTHGTTSVSGTGTAFTTELAVGDDIVTSNGLVGTVASIFSSSNLTLTGYFDVGTDASATAYTIIKNPSRGLEVTGDVAAFDAAMSIGNTTKIGFGVGLGSKAFTWTHTNAVLQGFTLGGAWTVSVDPTISNTAGLVVNPTVIGDGGGTFDILPNVKGVLHAPTYTAANGLTASVLADAAVYHGPTFNKAGTGVFAQTETTGLYDLPVIDGVTVLTRRGVWVRPYTSANGGVATTDIGVDVEALTGTNKIGIRNASTDVGTPLAATMSAVSSTIPHTARVVRLNNTSGGSLTITAAPTISDGQDGEILIVFNGSTNSVTIQDQGTLASSNLRLSATTVALGTRDSIMLMYSSTVGDWIQIGQTNVL